MGREGGGEKKEQATFIFAAIVSANTTYTYVATWRAAVRNQMEGLYKWSTFARGAIHQLLSMILNLDSKRDS
jgi:hypothetical protein